MSRDVGGLALAAALTRLAAAGDHDHVRELLAPLDADQLRELVLTLAVESDRGAKAPSACPPGAVHDLSGPSAVCDVAIRHAAAGFGTTPEAILGADRHRTVTDARAAAMTAIRRSGLTLTVIADHFGKDHTSVIHAVRRTEDNPRLSAAAARIGHHIAEHYCDEHQTNAVPDPNPDWTPRGSKSTGPESRPARRPDPPQLPAVRSRRGVDRGAARSGQLAARV